MLSLKKKKKTNNMSDKKEVHVKASEDRMIPTYANQIRVAHTAEEFVLEMLAMFPPQGVLLNRVVISPEHAKRLRDALTENIKKYEASYKKIVEAVVPFDTANIQTSSE